MPSKPPAADAETAGRHRSGAVARMLNMPVATLRVWERRYQLSKPALTASGQRLYSADDVQRLALVKRLSDLGHAIGSLAALDMQALQRVAATHARVLTAQARLAEPPSERATQPARIWRVAVIGAALGKRLQALALQRRLGRPVQLLGPFENAAQAEAALGSGGADLLLLQEASPQATWLASLQAAAPLLAALPKALLYRFAADATCDSLAAHGIALLREPQADAVLGQWLQGLLAETAQEDQRGGDASGKPKRSARRWDDAALADFAGLSSTVACECPRHLAELLLQLAHFESYSAECEQRSPADAELHRYLSALAADSRARFEDALEHVALLEGLILPPSLA